MTTKAAQQATTSRRATRLGPTSTACGRARRGGPLSGQRPPTRCRSGSRLSYPSSSTSGPRPSTSAKQTYPVRRCVLRAEVNAAMFQSYGYSRDDLVYVMDTFPIVRRNDEKTHRESLTMRLILERYDALAAAAASGVRYQTPLDPPPAHPAVAHAAHGGLSALGPEESSCLWR